MRWLACLALLIGCVKPSSTSCEDGTTCPSGTQCVQVMTTLGLDDRCASALQLAACMGMANRTSCAWKEGTGTCHDGACLPDECGNALVDSIEACDDGNTIPGDGCSRDCRSDETCGNGSLDVEVAVPEQCDERGGQSHDGCSSDCRREQPTWTSVPDERPPPRLSAGFAYDTARRTTVLFGGRTLNPSLLLHTTSEWDGTRWRTLATEVSPTNRSCTQMAYDAAHGELVLFSGDNAAGDTWTFDGAWHLRTPKTMSPPARSCGRMVYDAADQRVILFGGRAATELDDTWAWDGTDWAELSQSPPNRPGPRGNFSMAYDPSRNVIVLYGGESGTTMLGDLWEFDGANWHQVTFSGGPGNRMATAMAFDPVHQNMLIIGGESDTTPFPVDAWAWNGTTWTQRANVPSVSVPDLAFASAATDPVRDVIVVVGTAGGLWEWNGAAWTKSADGTTTAIVAPQAREGAAMALDSKRNRIFMFGGVVQGSPAKSSNEEWIWTGGWITVPATTPMPSPRDGVGLAYDEAHDELVLYGGCLTDSSASPSPTTDAFADTWVYKNSAWTQRFATSPPGLRCEPGMTYDAKRGQIVLVGGYDPRNTNGVTYPPSTWTWDGSTWTQAATTLPVSPSRTAPAVGYDRKNERVVMFGGFTPQGPASDTLLWDGQTWTIASAVQHPRARGQAQLGWDAARGRLVLFGGANVTVSGDFVLGDTWEWDGAAWTQSVDGPTRRYVAMAPATDGAGLMVFGGNAAPRGSESTQQRKADTWRMRWDGDARYEACTDSDNDTDGAVGCADPDCGWACLTCGNGSIDAPLDTCYRCPADAGTCPM